MSVFPEAAILLVNWNLKDDTAECIRSLLESGADAGQIIVVDNGSTDGSVDVLRAAFGPELVILETGENLGFTGGVNTGVQEAMRRGAEWMLLINNDTTVAEDFLAKFRTEALTGLFDLLGCTVYYYSEPEIVWYLADELIPGTLLTRNRYRNRPLPAGLREAFQADFICGCGMLVRREVFGKIGGLDTGLFMYGEEVDFTWRARLSGFRIGAAPAVSMWHKIGKSSEKDKPFTRYLRVRNQGLFYRRYASGLMKVLMFTFSLVRSTAMAAGALAAGDRVLFERTYRAFADAWFTAEPARGTELAGMEKS